MTISKKGGELSLTELIHDVIVSQSFMGQTFEQILNNLIFLLCTSINALRSIKRFKPLTCTAQFSNNHAQIDKFSQVVCLEMAIDISVQFDV